MKAFLEKLKKIKLSGWISITLAVITPVLAYFGMTGEDFTTWGKVGEVIVQAVSNPYVVFLMLVGLYGAIQNPKTKGVI